MDRAKAIAIAKEAAIWVPTLLLVAVFIPQGIGKFSATSGWAPAFRHWGFPHWFLLLIGAVEFGAALLLLWRRTAPIGALMIICVMVGAMATHTFIDGKPREVFHEVVPLTLSTIVLLARRPQLQQLLAAVSRRARAPGG